MELHVDYAITSKYSECHDFYNQNIKIFKSFVSVIDVYFKKEKFQNSKIKIDEDAKDIVTIKFCSNKYQIGLCMNPADLNTASIVLSKINQDHQVKIGEATMDHSGNIVFPAKNKVSLNDDCEFNNAVLSFIIDSITKNSDEKTATR